MGPVKINAKIKKERRPKNGVLRLNREALEALRIPAGVRLCLLALFPGRLAVFGPSVGMIISEKTAGVLHQNSYELKKTAYLAADAALPGRAIRPGHLPL